MADPPSDRSLYHTHPTTCAPDDFWGQVKRTVDGRPVAPAQIAMIVEQVARGLEIGAGDTLLDLCCGNGALTTLFFARCAGGLGVDESEPLVRVATENFVRRPSEAFLLQEAVDFVRSWPGPERFTIGLCYGAISYLTTAEAEMLLATVHRRFRRVRRVFLGNLPDRAHVRTFFGARYRAGVEDEAGSPLGIWRTVDEVHDLADRCGWRAEILRMPVDFYAAHYRYDVVLTRAKG